jgi:putative ABC transport system permease protein
VTQVRRTKVLREVWLFRARTLLVVVAIGVGVGTFGLMDAGRSILQRDMQEGFDATTPAQAVLSLTGFDDPLLRQVTARDGVAVAEGRRALSTSIAVGSGTWVTLDLQAARDWDAVTLSRLVHDSGAGLRAPPGSVLLERSAASQFGFAVGQRVRVRTADGREHVLRVAGLVLDQAALPSNINPTAAHGYVGLQTLADLGEPRDLNQLYVRFSGGRPGWPGIETSATRLVRTLEQSGHRVDSVSIPRPGKPPLSDTMNGVLFILTTMGVLTLLLAALLIINMMWAVITRQIPQIGVLKSLGARPRQIVRMYVEMVLIFGLLALVLALPLALGGAFAMTTGVGRTLNVTIRHFGLPPATLATLVVAAFGVPVLAAMVPVLSGARTTIREAISGPAAGASRRTPRDSAFRRRWRALRADVPTLLLASVRNTFRRAGRLALTLVALSLAGAMFVAVLGVRQSLQETAVAMQGESNYDVDVSLTQPRPVADLLRTALGVTGVSDAEAWGMGDARPVFGPGRVGGSLVLVGIPGDSSMWRPSVTEGRRLQPGDHRAVFVNADALEQLHGVPAGQPVTLRIGDRDARWRLVGVSARGLVPIAYIPYAAFERAVGTPAYASRLVVRTTGHSPGAQSSVQRALVQALGNASLDVAGSTTTAVSNRSVAANLDIIAVMLLAMVALVALVGGLGLASTMSINVLERTREIGVLRALGARTPAVRRIVIVEGLLIGLVSAVVGVVASVPLGIWLCDQLGPRVLYHPLPFIFSWQGAAGWLVVVAVIAVLASLAPAQSAARMTIRETLAFDG